MHCVCGSLLHFESWNQLELRLSIRIQVKPLHSLCYPNLIAWPELRTGSLLTDHQLFVWDDWMKHMKIKCHTSDYFTTSRSVSDITSDKTLSRPFHAQKKRSEIVVKFKYKLLRIIITVFADVLVTSTIPQLNYGTDIWYNSNSNTPRL